MLYILYNNAKKFRNKSKENIIKYNFEGENSKRSIKNIFSVNWINEEEMNSVMAYSVIYLDELPFQFKLYQIEIFYKFLAFLCFDFASLIIMIKRNAHFIQNSFWKIMTRVLYSFLFSFFFFQSFKYGLYEF